LVSFDPTEGLAVGTGLVGRFEYTPDKKGKCEKGHDMMKIESVKLFSIGRDWTVEGYFYCPTCKLIYQKM